MIDIPAELRNKYTSFLAQRQVPLHSHNIYFKWLRFYLDFCNKHQHTPSLRGSLPFFIEKLHKKKQTSRQQEQAQHAIHLYYALVNNDRVGGKLNQAAVQSQDTTYKPTLTSGQTAWEKIYLDVAIKVRHYSPKTYKTYAGWTRQLQSFTRQKGPALLTIDDVKSFLTYRTQVSNFMRH